VKFIFLSDMHLLYQNPVGRVDNLVEEQWKKLQFVLEFAKNNDCIILQAGDFFDRPRSWQLLPITIDLLKKYQVRICSVYGQHDTYLYAEETRDRTNLGILQKVGLVEILTNEPVEPIKIHSQDDVFIYGSSFGGEIPEPSNPDAFNILVIHAPIADLPLFFGHEITLAKKFLLTHDKYDVILCGDVHRRFSARIGKRMIVNTGPMLRKEASEYNFSHSPEFAIYNTDIKELEWVGIPHRPAFEVLSRAHIERQNEAESLLEDFIESMKEDIEQGVSFSENLRIFLKENRIEPLVVDCLAKIMEGKG